MKSPCHTARRPLRVTSVCWILIGSLVLPTLLFAWLSDVSSSSKLENQSVSLDPANPRRYATPSSGMCSPDVCATTGSGHDAPIGVVLVHSACENKPLRDAIRSTWGQKWRARNSELRLVFVLGSCGMKEVPKVDHESKLYRDILTLNVTEDYRALTVKSLSSLEWTQVCATCVDYVVKCDDDSYVKADSLAQYVRSLSGLGVWGHLNVNASVMRSGLWQLSVTEYAREKYPPYASGNLYIISNSVVGTLLRCHMQGHQVNSSLKKEEFQTNADILNAPGNSSLNDPQVGADYVIPYVPFEDVYVTGLLTLCARVAIHHDPRFPGWLSGPSLPTLRHLLTGDLFGLHGIDYARMYEIHAMMLQCSGAGCHGNTLYHWFQRIKEAAPFV